MASFTDIVPQFNPYVEQLPIEAMVKVGTYKQQKYDEGIQKIQGYIDNIAGLDIYKDIHKEYLQSKLNELGNNLGKVAGGDFSNFQLVNSVSGMANQVIKDPIIQNAVASTAKLRKEIEASDADLKAGASPENSTWFSKKINEWATDGDLKSSFNGKYTKYRDLNKKWMEVQKELGATDITTQLPYYQDDQGRFTDEKGNILPKGAAPVVNEVMIEKIFKGKSPQAIKNAIMASMDEGDIEQMHITGWYHYKDTPVSSLKEIADKKYTDYVGSLNKQLSAWTMLKTLNPSNKEYQNTVDARIKEINDDFANSTQEYENTIKLIKTNPDSFRSSLYAQHAINDFANGFSNYTESIKYVDNPYQTKRDKDRTYSLAVDRFKEEQRHNKAQETLDWNKYLLDLEKSKKEDEKNLKTNALFNPGGLDQTLINGITEDPLEAFEKDLANTKTTLDNAKLNLKNQYFKNESLENFAKDYALHYDAYNNGTETNKVWTKFFDNYASLESQYELSASSLKEIQDEATKKFGPNVLPTVDTKIKENLVGDLFGGTTGGFIVPVPGKKTVHYEYPKAKLDYINSEIAKISANYQPRSYSLNIADDKQKSFIKQQVSMILGRISTDKGKQETDPRVTENFNLDNSVLLNSEANTSYYVTTQGNNVYITLQGKVGDKAVPEQTLRLTNSEFQNAFGQSATSSSQKAYDRIFQIGSTSINAKFKNSDVLTDEYAHEAAMYKKIRGGSARDNFPRIEKYNVKANIFRLPGEDGNPSGDYQSVFYIQVPDGSGGKKWKTFQGASSPYLEILEKSMMMLTDADIKKNFF